MADGMLLLSWNSHHATFCDILSRLREKESFTDVTLACEGKCYPLHKLVLSACSEYLEKIIKSTPCKHPVIVLQDIRCSELEALINYMYVGEVNVPQSSLTFLIKAAELLQIKGLAVPDEPPSTNKKKASTHVSDDQTSPQVKRKKYDSSSSICQQEHTQISSSPSPHHRERKHTSDYSKTQPANADQVVDQHHSSENSLGCIQDVFVETGIKEEVLEDINTDINLNAADPGLDYQTHNNSSYEVEDTRIENNTEGKGSFPLSVEYERQSLDHQEMLSQAPIVSVSASEVQGWMTEGTLGGELTAVEGYSGVGVLDSSTMITQQGATSQEEQMVKLCTNDQRKGREETTIGTSTHKKHECPDCPYATTQPSLLFRHLINHSGESFSCVQCSYQCTSERDLKMHQRNHTVKPHCCPHCLYRTSKKYNLQIHIRSHTGEKPFSCPHCPFRSTNRSDLRKHIYTHRV
ncbi:hypothetical protein OTU49_003358 [Cherax quadricarinatus]|uniref:Uncharacterized protein n=1 Tax=Cherax quadricarinatus TaxID=27406 RepID=A0AAW0YNV6_CHEQU|nr:longitudinals lacking protein, isoforms H/M/V-like isoform X3 [Cherax quadricarinatus]